MAETELIYRVYILEPRYTEAILQIAYSHRFSRDYEFLGIEKFDAIGRTHKNHLLFGTYYLFIALERNNISIQNCKINSQSLVQDRRLLL